jgi:hypothetical protein
MLLHKENLNRKTIIDFLKEKNCKITFNKVKDNTTRTILGTLNPSDLPERYNLSLDKVFSEDPYDPDIVPIWDIIEGAWKSFRISKIITFNVVDTELDKKEGHRQKSNQQKVMEEKKQKEKEKFAERVQKSKQDNLQMARDIINKLRSNKGNIS